MPHPIRGRAGLSWRTCDNRVDVGPGRSLSAAGQLIGDEAMGETLSVNVVSQHGSLVIDLKYGRGSHRTGKVQRREVITALDIAMQRMVQITVHSHNRLALVQPFRD